MHPSSTFRCLANLPATSGRVMTPIRGSPRRQAARGADRADAAGGQGVADLGRARAERLASRIRPGRAKPRPRFPAADRGTFLSRLRSMVTEFLSAGQQAICGTRNWRSRRFTAHPEWTGKAAAAPAGFPAPPGRPGRLRIPAVDLTIIIPNGPW